MSEFWIKAVQLLLSLSLLIVLHEGGHYAAARAFNTRVEKFFLFFDVKFALFKKKIGETVYGIGWLPLGGYVKISGMIDESMDKEQMAKPPEPWEFRSKPAWQRLIIMLGGVTVNVIVGFLIFMMILFVWGQDYLTEESLPEGFVVAETLKDYGFEDGDWVTEVNGKPLDDMFEANKYLMVRKVNTMTVKHQNGETQELELPENIGKKLFEAGETFPFMPVPSTVIDSVLPNSPAAEAGLKKGDKVLRVNETEVSNIMDFNKIRDLHKGEELKVEVQSGDEVQTLAMTPDDTNKFGFVGKMNMNPKHRSYSFGESIKHGFSYTYWTLSDYVGQFKYVFTKKGASQLGGFGTIGSLFQPKWDWQSFWHTTAFISIILAFMNILPIPALDGGHVMFLLYEMVSGRKPNEKVLEFAQMIGILILLALVLYANGNDIYRYFFEK